MARNSEKQRTKDKEQIRSYDRPPLDTVKTARDIRKWLPKIKKELQYNIEQLEVNRNYSTHKIKEFKERAEFVLFELEREYKSWMKKAYELEPNAKWIPGEKHSYQSKRKNVKDERETKEKNKMQIIDNADIIENKNLNDGDGPVTKRRRIIPKLDLPLSNGVVFKGPSGNPIIVQLKNKH